MGKRSDRLWDVMRASVLLVGIGLFSAQGFASQAFVEGEVIVKFRPGLSASSMKVRQKAGKRMKLQKSFNSLKMQQYKGQDGQSTHEMMSELLSDPNVEYVEPNYILSKTEVEGSQAYTKTEVLGFASGFGLTAADIMGEEGWDEVDQANLPVVAIIDTGVELSHDAIVDALWENPGEIANNGIDDDGNGFVDDVNGWNFVSNNNYPNDCDGHGTHVAGIVRGTTQYLFADPLDTPVIKIMPLKFLDCNGLGTTADAIKAIYYAVQNGAKVLNNSWGGGNYSQALHEAIAYSYNAKTLFVAASGNYSTNVDSSPLYPASYPVPNVISVGASTDNDYLASFSNYGSGSVHIAAPGVWVLSAYLNNEYSQMSGTSMATPLVAGVAAMMVNEQPNMTGYQLRNIILQSADVEGDLNNKIQGNRRLNSMSSVATAKAATVDPSQPKYVIYPSSDDRELASSIASGGGSGCGIIKLASDVASRSGTRRGPPTGKSMAIGFALLIPILLWMYMRQRYVDPQKRRQHQRYGVDSKARVYVGGEVHEAVIYSVSAGGVGLKTDASLSDHAGKTITVFVEQPGTGDYTIQLEGEMVWKGSHHEVGVRFEKPVNWFVELLDNWDLELNKI